VLSADPVPGWRYLDLTTDTDTHDTDTHDTDTHDTDTHDTGTGTGTHGTGTDGGGGVEERVAAWCARERVAVGEVLEGPVFRVALMRTGVGRYRLVVTCHHVVIDGWSLPIVLQEIVASYVGVRLPAAVPYRRFVGWLAERDLAAARVAWGQVLEGFDTPTVLGPAADRVGLGPRAVAGFGIDEAATRAVGELARAQRTTVNTVLQAGWAVVLGAVTGARDVAFGAVVSGRPEEVSGVESMVGLLINTVPVRVRLDPQATVVEVLAGLRADRHATVEHQHLGLAEMHRLTGLARLFDTVLVYENYPVDSAGLTAQGLSITDASVRDYYHYPLAVQVIPGPALRLLVQYRTDVFPAAVIETLIATLQRVLAAMSTDPDRALASLDTLDTLDTLDALGGQGPGATVPPLHPSTTSPTHDTAPTPGHPTPNPDPDPGIQDSLQEIYTHILGVEHIDPQDSFFDLGGDSHTALRLLATINTTLNTTLDLPTLLNAPTITTLTHHLTTTPNHAQ
jgi:hypothetical protein